MRSSVSTSEAETSKPFRMTCSPAAAVTCAAVVLALVWLLAGASSSDAADGSSGVAAARRTYAPLAFVAARLRRQRPGAAAASAYASDALQLHTAQQCLWLVQGATAEAAQARGFEPEGQPASAPHCAPICGELPRPPAGMQTFEERLSPECRPVLAAARAANLTYAGLHASAPTLCALSREAQSGTMPHVVQRAGMLPYVLTSLPKAGCTNLRKLTNALNSVQPLDTYPRPARTVVDPMFDIHGAGKPSSGWCVLEVQAWCSCIYVLYMLLAVKQIAPARQQCGIGSLLLLSSPHLSDNLQHCRCR